APPHHHPTSVLEPLRAVVRGANIVALNVRKLAFNPIAVEPGLIEDRACGTSQSVNGKTGMVPHTINRIDKRVLGNDPLSARGWKNVFASPSHSFQLLK